MDKNFAAISREEARTILEGTEFNYEIKICRAKRKLRRSEEKKENAEAYKKQRDTFLGMREKLYQSALRPIVDRVRRTKPEDLRSYNEVAFAWDVNPHFMNCSSGHGVLEEPSKVISQVSNVTETNEKNRKFIEKYSGQTFQSFEEAQNFMLQDAYQGDRPIGPQKCDDPISQEEIDAIHNSTKFSCELDAILERVN